tara:strand:+ start:1081 stop:1368 length:288 start_codon:yes stop_codon:yes gene_type:complete
MLALIIILSLTLVAIFIIGMFFDPEFGMGPELLFSSFGFCVLLICVIGCSFGYSSDRLIQKIESGEMHIQKSGYKVMNGDTTILYTVKSKNKDDE